MQVIQLNYPYDPKQIIQEPIVLALGFFDGVHRGHQEVIGQARQIADQEGLPLAVLTFTHTPKVVYQTIHPYHYGYLTDNRHKLNLFEGLGVDLVYLSEFTWQMGAQSPQEFVDRYLVGLHAQHVVAGFDYTYGPVDQANMTTLKSHSQGRFEVREVPPQLLNQEKIGARTIKEDLKAGQIDRVNQALGYPYQTSGIVMNGYKRGRTIGYPTANIATDPHQILPGVGVYVVEILVQGVWYQGMASVGYNVTFQEPNELTCEVYILDFNRMIYGERVEVKWHHYLRGEIKFDQVADLVSQLDQDLVDTRAYFDN